MVTSNEKEKVRYVKFDKVGHQLITGIANLTPSQAGAGAGAGAGAAREEGEGEDQRRYNVIMDR